MKKKVDISDIEFGMYISDLDRPWLGSPFLFQGFELRDRDDLEKLQKLCKYVVIDTEQGVDVSPSYTNRGAAERQEALESAGQQISREVSQLADGPQSPSSQQRQPPPDITTLEQELVHAKKAEAEVRETALHSVRSVQRGQPIDLDVASKAVSGMVDSVVRNPDALVCLSQLKDASEYTALHSVRTCTLALAFGRHLVFNSEQLLNLGLGALMHDIGMAALPQELLKKPDRYTQEETKIMRTHVPRGVSIATQAGFPKDAVELVEQHHARHDGSGYPKHLDRSSIGVFGAIGAIVDVYDALTSETAYRESLSAEDSLKKIYEWRTNDFNTELVEEFIKCMGIFPIGSLVELSTGSIGVVITVNRSRRLKPKVALVLTPEKRPYHQKTVIDLAQPTNGSRGEVKIKQVLPSGSFGINPMDHIILL